jgi:starvation-inducible DNA-binding protein
MDLISTLEQVFATNFEVYYRTHVSHVNTVGRNFYSDHKLLQKIYEELQDNIDTQAEFLRTLRTLMPESLGTVLELSATGDRNASGDADDLLQGVYDDLEVMIDLYQQLNEVADEEQHDEIANYAQDQMRSLRRFCWMIRSTLEGRIAPEDEY